MQEIQAKKELAAEQAEKSRLKAEADAKARAEAAERE